MDRLTKWLFGTKSYFVLVLGEDSAGKSTFIERLKHDSVTEDPAPTHLFNHAEVQYPSCTEWQLWEFKSLFDSFFFLPNLFLYSGSLFEGDGLLTPGIAAKHQIGPLVRKQFTPEALVLWLHDCTGYVGPLSLFKSLLREMIQGGTRYIWVALNKQDAAGVNRAKIDKIRMAYQEVFIEILGDTETRWDILTHRLSPKTGEGVIDVLDEMHSVVRNVDLVPNETNHPTPSEEIREVMKEVAMDDLQARIKQEISGDTLDADEFWKLFQAGELQSWNHYAYLKILYLVTLDSPRKNASEVSEDLLARMNWLRHCHQHRFKAEDFQQGKIADGFFAPYLTAFWVLQIQIAIRHYRRQSMMVDLPSRDDFHPVLQHSPTLMNSELWKTYYSDNGWHKPKDMQSHLSIHRGIPELSLCTHFRTDPAIIPESDKTPERLMRYAFFVWRHVDRTGARRGEIVAQALQILQRTTIQLRTTDPSSEVYSETQVSFWIQMVQAALSSLDEHEDVSEKQRSHGSYPANLTFDGFQETFGLEATAWKTYYSKKSWNSVGARLRFIAPDIRPLPNVIAPIAKINTRLSQSPDVTVRLPSIEELSFRAAMVVQETADPKYSCSSAPICNHAHLLHYLYHELASEVADYSNPLTIGQRAQILFTETSGALVDAATHRNFWIQQVGVAMADAVIDRGGSTFAEFLSSNLGLVCEDLPGVFYRPGTWARAADATQREKIVAPDRRRLMTIFELADSDDWVHIESNSVACQSL
ncbi:hypothetical protein BJY04DRAFT_223179 [Aspergillus karnatakaensis]|uniref:uncharacterized protein n=1 Tax=Aspergillus karnatakaensis TaxID=1810916 RepID=UPI003CCE4ADE